MGAWGITMRESDYGLDLLMSIEDRQLKAVDFSVFNVVDALEIIKEDIIEEIRKANRSCNGEEFVFYFSENFPRNFSWGAILLAECLADYYRTGEHILYESTDASRDPVERHIKKFVITKNTSKILLDELQIVQDPEHEIYQCWIDDETRMKWLEHVQSVYQTLKEHMK